METSAKNATNVEQAFMAMAADIKTRYSSLVYNGLFLVLLNLRSEYFHQKVLLIHTFLSTTFLTKFNAIKMGMASSPVIWKTCPGMAYQMEVKILD